MRLKKLKIYSSINQTSTVGIFEILFTAIFPKIIERKQFHISYISLGYTVAKIKYCNNASTSQISLYFQNKIPMEFVL